MKKRVLVIGAHLDDSIIAVGGIIRKFVAAGAEVNVVCFGNGDEAFTSLAEKVRAPASFRKEAVEAHKMLGVKEFVCFDVPDFGVQKSREAYRLCIQSIRKYRPHLILGHYWAEYFQHHEMAGQSRDAWWQSAWDCSADLGTPWSAGTYYHFEVLHDLPEPTHIVDISDTFAAKMAAWKRFETAEDHLGSLAEQLEARARYHGSKIGVQYAEVLKQSFFVSRKVMAVKELF